MSFEGYNYGDQETLELTSLQILQAEAASKSATIGAFQETFRVAVSSALEDGRLVEDEEAAKEHVSTVTSATSGHESIALDATPNGVLGYNHIGAGDSGMRISKQSIASVGDYADGESLDQTIAHESAHGQQVQLHGSLEIDGEEVDHLLLYEGHAEIKGNEAIGRGVSHHREGQPEEVYSQGQNAALVIIQRAGRAAFEKALTQDGDLSRLQDAMDREPQVSQQSYAVAA